MTHRVGYRTIALLTGLGLTAPAMADSSINLGLGTTGLVVEYDRLISDRFHARGSLHYFSYDEEFDEEGVEYDGEIKSTHAGALLDYHPFSGFFRLSAGLFVTDLAIDLDAVASQDEYEIGDNTYLVEDGNNDPLRLSADIEFAPVSPYFGFGWGNSPGEGLGFSLDIGVLVVGEAELDYDASGTVTQQDSGLTIDVERNAEFQEDLQKERDELEDEFEDFSIYPVVTLGVSYTF